MCRSGIKQHAPAGLAVLCQADGEGLVGEQLGQALAQGLARAGVVRQAQVAANDVLQQAHARLFRQRQNHVVQHCAHREEPLCGLHHIPQPHLRNDNIWPSHRLLLSTIEN